VRRLIGFLARYLAWLVLAAGATLGGALAVMLFRDWTLEALLASSLAWPLLGMAAVAAVPIAMLGVGRLYLYTALGGGLLYSLLLALV
jgi:hypothetical protein